MSQRISKQIGTLSAIEPETHFFEVGSEMLCTEMMPGSHTASSGYAFSTIVLPNDKFYGIYGTVTGNLFYIYGMLTGQGSSGTDTYTANVTDFFYTGATYSDTLTVTDVPGSSVNGTGTYIEVGRFGYRFNDRGKSWAAGLETIRRTGRRIGNNGRRCSVKACLVRLDG
jgi:hypothetical protein